MLRVERVSPSWEAMVEVDAMRVRYRRGLEGEEVEADEDPAGGLVAWRSELSALYAMEIRPQRAHHAAAVVSPAPGEVEVDPPPTTSSKAATTVSDKPTGALRCAALRSGIGADPRLVRVCEGVVAAVARVDVDGECGGVPVPVPVPFPVPDAVLLRGVFLSLAMGTVQSRLCQDWNESSPMSAEMSVIFAPAGHQSRNAYNGICGSD